MTMMNLADIRKQIAAATEAIAKADTELKWELAASAADVAGMVDPTPTSDLIGAGLAVRKGDWFGAGMSVASMVPYVGDALAKPAKAVRAAKKINALRETLAKMTAKLAELKKAEKQAEAAEAAAKEAKIAKEASEAASKRSAKQTADSQEGTAKAGKDKDCEDCSTAETATPSKKQTSKKAATAPEKTKQPAATKNNPKTNEKIDPDGLCKHLRQGSGKGPYRGGAHSKTQLPVGDGKDSHHLPAKDVSPLNIDDGPAIQMSPTDHKRTSSNGSSRKAKKYRKDIEDMLKDGQWRDVMAKEIKDVRRVARLKGSPKKYNEAMLEMLEYFKCLENNNLLP